MRRNYVDDNSPSRVRASFPPGDQWTLVWMREGEPYAILDQGISGRLFEAGLIRPARPLGSAYPNANMSRYVLTSAGLDYQDFLEGQTSWTPID